MKLLFHCSQNPPIKLKEEVISPLKMEDAESDIMEDPSPTPMTGDVPVNTIYREKNQLLHFYKFLRRLRKQLILWQRMCPKKKMKS